MGKFEHLRRGVLESEGRGVVSFDRALIVRILLLTTLFVWPLIVYGHAAVFTDTASYYRSGSAAVSFAKNKLHIAPQIVANSAEVQARHAPATAPQPGGQELKAGRSVTYSVFAYALHHPNGRMIALVVVQSVLAAFVVACLIGAYSALALRGVAVVGVFLALLTPLAFEVAFAMPDLFGGLMVAAFVLLATEDRSLSKPIKGALTALGAIGVAAHAGNPPLAIILVGSGAFAILRWTRGRRVARLTQLALPLVLGMALTIVSGFIAFKEVGIAPGRFPLTLARSIDNGPGKLYLDEHCPTRHYAVCEVFNNKVPSTIQEFLWAENGLRYRATADQMRRIRAEEAEIVWGAALEHPALHFGQAARDILRQIGTFGLRALAFDRRLVVDDQGRASLEETGQSMAMRDAVALISFYVAIGAALLGALEFGQWDFRQRNAMVLICIALVTNAIISAVFSGVVGRYQSRLMWLFPLQILLFTTTQPLRGFFLTSGRALFVRSTRQKRAALGVDGRR